MARRTKRTTYQEWLVIKEEFMKVTDELEALVEERKCRPGVLLVHTWYGSVGYRWFSGAYYSWKVRHTSASTFWRWTEHYREDLEKARTLIRDIHSGAYHDELLNRTGQTVDSKQLYELVAFYETQDGKTHMIYVPDHAAAYEWEKDLEAQLLFVRKHELMPDGTNKTAREVKDEVLAEVRELVIAEARQ